MHPKHNQTSVLWPLIIWDDFAIVMFQVVTDGQPYKRDAHI
mgnify:CR=1 FL=1